MGTLNNMIFLDLKSKEELSIYPLGKNGKASSGEAQTVPLGEDYSFTAGAEFKKTEESCLSLPLSLLNFRVIEMPFSDRKRVRELLPFEIDGLILGGSGSAVFDAHILGESGGKSRVLVVYLMKDVLRAILEGLKSSGFDPRIITSLELADAVSNATGEQEIMDRILSAEPLSEEARITRAAEEIKRPVVNLRTGEFSYTADLEQSKKSLKITAILAVLLLTVFLADMTMMILAYRKENSALKNDLRRTYLSLFPGEKKITNEVYQLRAHYKELQGKEESFSGVEPLQTLLTLSGITGADVVFTEVTVDKELVILKGESPSLTEVQKLKGELDSSFTGVKISDTKPSAEDKTVFTLTAKRKGS
jgi:type II secretory pathway component PulL